MSKVKLMVDVSSSWDGTISASEFYSAAISLSQRWKVATHSLPPWSWISSRKPHLGSIHPHEGSGYLSLEKMCIFRSSKSDDSETGVAGTDESKHHEESPSDAVLVEGSTPEVHYYDFHVIYSNSYKVPVMYFRGYTNDGQPLVLDDVESDLPANSAKVLKDTRWTFITQEEHPHLNRPWFTLHPCGTNELMRLLYMGDESLAERRRNTEQYLISWLSIVGQVVGLKVPLQMVGSVAT